MSVNQLGRESLLVRSHMREESSEEVERSAKSIEADLTQNPRYMDESLFSSEEEDTLFDAYQMLRDAGVPENRLSMVRMVIESTTTYTADELEAYYDDIVKE